MQWTLGEAISLDAEFAQSNSFATRVAFGLAFFKPNTNNPLQ